jgi:voltage-gated sodium channel
MMGLEIDHDLGLLQTISEHFFVSVWTIEMILRMYTMGVKEYFHCSWIRLDFALAWLSIFGTWILPLLGYQNDMLGSLSILRLMRMLRIAQLVKVLHSFPELWLLVNGLWMALRTLTWVFVFLVIIVYVGGLFMATVVGSECGQDGVFTNFADCEDMFGSMLGSMYTLFQVLTLESWSMAVARPAIKGKPWLVIFFIVFLFLTSFGLMNIVTGIIVEQTIQASSENEEKLSKQKLARQRVELALLRHIFESANEDGDLFMNGDEFVEICSRKDVRQIFAELDLPVSRSRLAARLFEVLDGDGDGQMAIEEFMEAVMRLKNEGRGLVRIQHCF